MIKKITLSILLTFTVGILWNNTYVHTNSFQPPLGRTGGPGQQTCATAGCHTGSPNSGPGSISINYNNDGENIYELGEEYSISVTVNDGGAGANRYGFQMVAFDAAGNSVGSFVGNPDTGFSDVSSDSGGREYIHHKSVPNPGPNNFDFSWIAPNTDVGPVTFYVAGLAANGNGTSAGDETYLNDFTVTLLPVGINDNSNLVQNINTYPNPVSNQLNVNFELVKPQEVSIRLLSINGQEQARLLTNTQLASGTQQQQFDLGARQLGSGLYVLEIAGEEFTTTQKIVVQ